MPHAHGVVTAGVERVAAQRFAPIESRTTCSVTVLSKMQPRDVELVGASDVRRRRRFGCRRKDLGFHPGLWSIGDNLFAVAVQDAQRSLSDLPWQAGLKGFYKERATRL